MMVRPPIVRNDDWVPGEPLYPEGTDVVRRALFDILNDEWEFLQALRFYVKHPGTYGRYACLDCEVAWHAEVTTECWNCGNDVLANPPEVTGCACFTCRGDAAYTDDVA